MQRALLSDTWMKIRWLKKRYSQHHATKGLSSPYRNCLLWLYVGWKFPQIFTRRLANLWISSLKLHVVTLIFSFTDYWTRQFLVQMMRTLHYEVRSMLKWILLVSFSLTEQRHERNNHGTVTLPAYLLPYFYT